MTPGQKSELLDGVTRLKSFCLYESKYLDKQITEYEKEIETLTAKLEHAQGRAEYLIRQKDFFEWFYKQLEQGDLK